MSAPEELAADISRWRKRREDARLGASLCYDPSHPPFLPQPPGWKWKVLAFGGMKG
ncbi:MAG: hypothetical protein GYA33_06170 [Thermogutta sp.]|nr:hypothetical protein [Thermogutta sp.]